MIAFAKATMVGGIAFLLPFGVVLVVLGKLVEIVRPIAGSIHDKLFPEAQSNLGAMAIAALILLAIAFAAGVFARSVLGRRIFTGLESRVLLQVPMYTLLRRTIQDFSGSADHLGGGPESDVVLVRFDDLSSIGFLIERRHDGQAVVFLPGAPSAFSGLVVIVDGDRVSPTKMTPTDVLSGMRKLGAGLAAHRAAR